MTPENRTNLEQGKMTKEMRTTISVIKKLISVSPTSGTDDFVIAGILLSEHYEKLVEHCGICEDEAFHFMINDIVITIESVENNPKLKAKMKEKSEDKMKAALKEAMDTLDSIMTPVKH
jgi:hypothetical protein